MTKETVSNVIYVFKKKPEDYVSKYKNLVNLKVFIFCVMKLEGLLCSYMCMNCHGIQVIEIQAIKIIKYFKINYLPSFNVCCLFFLFFESTSYEVFKMVMVTMGKLQDLCNDEIYTGLEKK